MSKISVVRSEEKLQRKFSTKIRYQQSQEVRLVVGICPRPARRVELSTENVGTTIIMRNGESCL